MTLDNLPSHFRAKFREKFTIWRRIPRLVGSLWHTSPTLASLVLVVRLLRACQPPAVLFVAKLVVDQVIAQTGTPALGVTMLDWRESSRFATLGELVFLEFLLVVGSNILTRFGAMLEGLLAELHSNSAGIQLIDQASSLDLKHIEESATQDKLQRAKASTMLGYTLISAILNQIQTVITIVLFVAGLIVFIPWLVVFLLAAVLPSLFVELHFNARSYKLATALVPDRRKMLYFQGIGASADAAKEVKLFGLGSFLVERLKLVSSRIFRANRDLAIRRAIFGSLVGTISSSAYYAGYIVVVWRAVTGEITVGDLTFLTGSLLRLNGLFEGLTLSMTQIASQMQYLGDFYTFMDMRSDTATPLKPRHFPRPIRKGITFESVGFRYPGKASWALRNLSFTLPAGQTLALVGENGSGKTTIVKLLTRLYEPDEGRILIDGVDLQEIDLTELRDHVGAIFQDFVRYHITVNDNIGVGRMASIGDRPRVVQAAQKSLADSTIEQLPDGYDQMLGRNFAQGVDLSGGEWQKLAIARAYFRDADVLILDEPTAALDPRTEAEIFDRFRNLSETKTTLLISHRFSTVRMADNILVLENGAILEKGSHAELIAYGGRYAELFELQALGFQ